jgi:hypothetical protein
MALFLPFCPARQESSAKGLFPLGLFQIGQGGFEEEEGGAGEGEDVDPVVTGHDAADTEVGECGAVVVGVEIAEDGFAPGIEGEVGCDGAEAAGEVGGDDEVGEGELSEDVCDELDGESIEEHVVVAVSAKDRKMIGTRLACAASCQLHSEATLAMASITSLPRLPLFSLSVPHELPLPQPPPPRLHDYRLPERLQPQLQLRRPPTRQRCRCSLPCPVAHPPDSSQTGSDSPYSFAFSARYSTLSEKVRRAPPLCPSALTIFPSTLFHQIPGPGAPTCRQTLLSQTTLSTTPTTRSTPVAGGLHFRRGALQISAVWPCSVRSFSSSCRRSISPHIPT